MKISLDRPSKKFIQLGYFVEDYVYDAKLETLMKIMVDFA